MDVMDKFYIRSNSIEVAHGFTTRLGGVSTGPAASMNLSCHRDPNPANVPTNFQVLGQLIGFSPNNLVLANQTHSKIIRMVTKEDHISFDSNDYPECDALLTRDPGTALCVFSADCVPILLWDHLTGAVGAVHAGWRGVSKKTAYHTIMAMEKFFRSIPSSIHAVIGPSLCADCFETDEDVPDALFRTYGKEISRYITRDRNGKFHPDLKAINAYALRRAGVYRIEILPDCTKCQPNLYFSHRGQGEERGTQGAIILCESDTVWY